MASPPIFDSGGNIPGGLPVMSDQEVHLLAGLLDPDFLTKQVEAHSRIFDSPHHITISDSEPPQALDNRFTLGVKYSSATSLATPSLFSTQSTDGVPAYIHDIKQVLGTMMYDQGRILNAVLDSERMQSRHRIMTIDRFNREFPVGRGLLYDIIVLTKSLVFQDEECLWGGKDLSDTSFHRIQRHASNAIAIITYDHSLGSDAPDDAIHMYPAHITEWATDAYLNEINRLRKDVRPITQQSFAFTDGTEEQDITDNLQRYHLAVGNAWYLKHHITALTFLQRFFFLEQQSVAWQLEKLLCKRPRLSSADEVLEGLPRVFSWSERCPPNCWSLTLMALRHSIEEWAPGKWKRLPFSDWDLAHYYLYRGSSGEFAILKFCMGLENWFGEHKLNIDFLGQPPLPDEPEL